MPLLGEEPRRWTVADAVELYEVPNWGKGYFSVSEQGHVCVHPTKNPRRSIDLKQLVDRLQIRGMVPPVLVRFGGILQHRLGELQAAFRQAIDEHNYQAGYHCVYPIKVNQQRQIVEEVLQFGAPYQFGLEAGSKPELLAVIAMASNEVPVVCNGFKDQQFVEMALLAQKIGRRVFLVVEKYTDLELIVQCAKKIDVRPNIGIRVKLASRGSGRWQSSSGYRAKFGLFASEMLRALEQLKAEGMEDCLKLLHFHIGSQVTNIRYIKAALNEAARIYVDLAHQGAGLAFMDVGGGLGVDYDGSQTNFESSSVNYTLQEYANDVVFHLQSVCDDAGVPHPTIFSESGRATVAYNSVLVFNVLGVSDFPENGVAQTLPPDAEQPLIDLMDTCQRVNVRNILECYHDAQQALDTAMSLFNAGYLSLVQRSLAENLYWSICRKVDRLSQRLDYVPEELEGLGAMLSETYFCNFSLFQSLPDSWAIKQLFPIMPIHRLEERPNHAAVLGDITCDSDGKIDRFIDRRNIKRALHLHSLDDRPYYLGAFLIGAYQEILGDLHNLFGDTNAVHVSIGAGDEVIVETMINGDSVREVLEYVQFDTPALVDRLRTAVDQAIRDNRISDRQAGQLLRFYQASLEGYTYLEDTHEGGAAARGPAEQGAVEANQVALPSPSVLT
jgi:arginine decarboxylase